MKLKLHVLLILLFSLSINAQNLVVNGSAEITPITSNGWTNVTGNWVASGANSQVSPQNGSNFFYGGNSTLSELSQTIDVSASATAIDAGTHFYTFSGYRQSYPQNPSDATRAVAEYLDQSGSILETFDTGYDNNVGAWIKFEDTRTTPIGTRTIRIRLFSLRNTGTSNDGLFDNIQLVESTNVLIPDMNFEQALVDQNIDSDGVVNGMVLRLDVVNITYLDVNSRNISDLTGIEAFASLETLFVYNNNLVTINVSQNIALTGLVAAINQLTSIDLSMNTNLISVSLNQNLLTTINLTPNTSLKQVYIENNNLNSIDVTALLNLEELVIPDNNINDLDVTLNDQLKILDCSANQISELNVLANVNLESFRGQNNMLEYVDLSQNVLLARVILNNNLLKRLDIKNGANTNISDLDFIITSNPDLTCIDVDDVTYSTNTWTQIDVQTGYSLDCSPTNNDCVNATSITLAQQSVSGTTQNATNGTTMPSCQEAGITLLDVWYEFIAPQSGSVTMTISALPLTAKIALYESCTAVTPLFCAEGELLADGLTPNTTYYLQVWLEANPMNRQGVPENVTGNFVLNIQDTTTLSLNESQSSINQIQLYPNPAKDKITITAETVLDAVSIYEMSGKRILQKENMTTNTETLQLENMSSGLYLVQIKTANTTIIKKLLIN